MRRWAQVESRMNYVLARPLAKWQINAFMCLFFKKCCLALFIDFYWCLLTFLHSLLIVFVPFVTYF